VYIMHGCMAGAINQSINRSINQHLLPFSWLSTQQPTPTRTHLLPIRQARLAVLDPLHGQPEAPPLLLPLPEPRQVLPGVGVVVDVVVDVVGSIALIPSAASIDQPSSHYHHMAPLHMPIKQAINQSTDRSTNPYNKARPPAGPHLRACSSKTMSSLPGFPYPPILALRFPICPTRGV